jgi:ubiquinone/menaquinone biosynthesis C-methylase UbiE
MRTMDTESYAQSLLATNPLREPILREMVKALRLPEGSQGLDAGCGIGLQCLLLAESIGASGHVTGLDVSADMMERGREIVKNAGFSQRISLRQGDIANLPFDDDLFDWAWSVDCVGYAPSDTLPLLKELARVVKPGGIVAIAAWSSETLLPGYPGLEARLRATPDGIAPFTREMMPECHFLRALGWFKELGLREVTARVFARSVSAPLDDDIREALVALFDMRWPNAQTELSPYDLEQYQRLRLKESPDFVLNLPDYYAFFTYSMFVGRTVCQGLPTQFRK